MTSRTPKKGKHETKQGGNSFPALCSAVGTILILGVILLLLPVTVPRLLGFEVFHVVSGSMTPTIPRGSMVLVKQAARKDIQTGDIIAFEREGVLVVHRVTAVQAEDGCFLTKGDANESGDLSPVMYDDLIGRVEHSIPLLGAAESQFSSLQGKAFLLILVVSGMLLRWLAGRIRASRTGR